MPVLMIINLVKTGLQTARDINTQDNFGKAQWKDDFNGADPRKFEAVGRGQMFEVKTKTDGREKRSGLISKAIKQVKSESGASERIFVVYDGQVIIVKGSDVNAPESEVDCLFTSNDGKTPCRAQDLIIKRGSHTSTEATYKIKVSNATSFKLKDSGRLWEFVCPLTRENHRLFQWLEAHSLAPNQRAEWESSGSEDEKEKKERERDRKRWEKEDKRRVEEEERRRKHEEEQAKRDEDRRKKEEDRRRKEEEERRKREEEYRKKHGDRSPRYDRDDRAPSPRSPYQDQPRYDERPRSPYEQPRSPYEQPRSPYEQPRSPYEQPRSPYEQPRPPHEQPKSPYGQPRSPYEQPSSPYEQPRYSYDNQPQGYQTYDERPRSPYQEDPSRSPCPFSQPYASQQAPAQYSTQQQQQAYKMPPAFAARPATYAAPPTTQPQSGYNPFAPSAPSAPPANGGNSNNFDPFGPL